jgi:two-component system, LytTR family, response regulator
MKRLNVLLIDDDPLCRQDLRDAFAAFPEVNLLGEASTLKEALSLTEKLRPNLAFLDLSLGHQDGFDLLRSLPSPPLCIAITADPTQGATGFEFDLVDYLVKPVDKARLAQALQRAIRRVSTQAISDVPSFLVEISHQKVLLQLSDIQQIEAMGNYVILHSAKGKGTIRSTLQNILRPFPKNTFLQLSRSRWVARNQVSGWHRKSLKLFVTLRDQTELSVSRRHASSIIKTLSPPPQRSQKNVTSSTQNT